MQSGISWEVVEKKWPTMKEAFHNFDPDWLVNAGPDDLDALTADTRVIRNRRKIEAIVQNARTAKSLEDEHGTFRNYLNSLGDYPSAEKDLKKRFKFLGDSGVYHFLYVVKPPRPLLRRVVRLPRPRPLPRLRLQPALSWAANASGSVTGCWHA